MNPPTILAAHESRGKIESLTLAAIVKWRSGERGKLHELIADWLVKAGCRMTEPGDEADTEG